MIAKEFINTFNERGASAFLLLLLAGDFIFVFLHFVNTLAMNWTHPFLNFGKDSGYQIGKDGGYAEIYQYLKYLWIIILLFLIAWKYRTWRYLMWVFVFVYFLADDSLQIHERVGILVATELSLIPFFGLRPEDFGELLVSIISGSILLIPIVIAYTGSSKAFRKTCHVIAALILLLVFFGVVVDMVHIIIDLEIDMGGKVSFILGVMEEGGEMISVSLLVWYFFLLYVRSNNGNPV